MSAALAVQLRKTYTIYLGLGTQKFSSFIHFCRFKNGTRLSCTFTNEQMRQIERDNRILLNKILAQRPNSGTRRTMNTTHERVWLESLAPKS